MIPATGSPEDTRISPYVSILSVRFRAMLQYRAAAVAGLFTQTFFGLVLVMVYEAFYRSTDATQPINFVQVVSYVWLGQATFALLPWNVDADVRGMVRSGAVAYELCRPLDLYNLWYARTLAWRTAPVMLRAAPMVLIAVLVLPLVGLEEWRLRPPAGVASGVAFAAAIGCTVLLSCAITMLLNISVLWTISGEGAVVVASALVVLLSGMIIPLPLLPEWAQRVVTALPFAGLVDLPFRVYVGHIPPSQVPAVLLHQVTWTAALVLAGRCLLSRGMRRVVVQGG